MIKDSFGARAPFSVGGTNYTISRLDALERKGISLSRLPYSIKVMVENLLRREDGDVVTAEHVQTIARWAPKPPEREISFMPARVLLQDFTGIPVVADLAAMRDAINRLGGDPGKVNPLQRADLVIDHSVQVDFFGATTALGRNAAMEFERNQERYLFLRWGQSAFDNLRVVPPDTGIVHQVNLEYLADVVYVSADGQAYPDTLVGTDSHTTMINGLGVLGWGVGGIEAEAAMLGRSVPMLIPEVVGVKFTGELPAGATATDLVLTIVQLLRAKGVVGKFVEYYGPGLERLTIADRATLGNMSPEYGATVGFFPVDRQTLDYLRLTGRSEEKVKLVEAYTKEQGLFYTPDAPEPTFSDRLELDLGTVEPSIAGPRRPQDRIGLRGSRRAFREELVKEIVNERSGLNSDVLSRWVAEGGAANGASKAIPAAELGHLANRVKARTDEGEVEIGHGTVLIAAITSCTNTSNPSVLLGAGILAKKAAERGLTPKPWVKTSLAPGSKVVTQYLRQAGLLPYLEQLHYHVVAYGCTTCIGNSGPIAEGLAAAVTQNNLVGCAVLSGNRNFEGRINPLVRFNYLASPPLVIAYALAGSLDWDFETDPLGQDRSGKPVFLRDIWPTAEEIRAASAQAISSEMFRKEYANVFEGDDHWRSLRVPKGELFEWQGDSTYVKAPPFFEGISLKPAPLSDIHGARVLVMLGNSVTTDHISPAGSIDPKSPAGEYLIAAGVKPANFNTYGARRGNHEVMMRGTFANIRLRNLLVPGVEGGMTVHLPDSTQTSIYEAAESYRKENVPLIVIAGKEYGAGSSRDWAAKGPQLLGVKAVIAESFERIHRSNLVQMGVLALQFAPGQGRESLGLTGRETYTIEGVSGDMKPGKRLKVIAEEGGKRREFEVINRADTPEDVRYLKEGGILPYVLRELASQQG